MVRLGSLFDPNGKTGAWPSGDNELERSVVMICARAETKQTESAIRVVRMAPHFTKITKLSLGHPLTLK